MFTYISLYNTNICTIQKYINQIIFSFRMPIILGYIRLAMPYMTQQNIPIIIYRIIPISLVHNEIRIRI